MPRHIIPSRSGPHRIACFALYRALLSQCLRIPLPSKLPSQGPVHPIKHLVRKQFRKHVALTSNSLVVVALNQGYQAEQLLREAAEGDHTAITKIHDILMARAERAQIQREKTAALEAARPPKQPKLPHRVPAPWPGADKVLETRPLPLERLTGPRRVPILTTATTAPFLRLHKPQSPFLSRVLRDKINATQKRNNLLDSYEDTIKMGLWEDEWDHEMEELRSLEREAARNDPMSTFPNNKRDRMTWAGSMYGERSRVHDYIRLQQAKDWERGTALSEIVEKERELWTKERLDRYRAKKAAKKAARLIASQGGTEQHLN